MYRWLCLLLAGQLALAFTPEAGKEYQLIGASGGPSGTVEIVEFFNYGCPACAHLEPFIEKWQKSLPTSVNFSRIPVEFHPQWQVLSKAYYVAHALGVEDTLTPLLFKAAQSGKAFNSAADLIPYFEKANISAKVLKSAYSQSPSLDAEYQQGKSLTKTYRIYQIPTFIVQKQYQTSPSMVKTPEDFITTLNYLIELAHHGKPRK